VLYFRSTADAPHATRGAFSVRRPLVQSVTVGHYYDGNQEGKNRLPEAWPSVDS
jgi:hypothetical protein